MVVVRLAEWEIKTEDSVSSSGGRLLHETGEELMSRSQAVAA